MGVNPYVGLGREALARGEWAEAKEAFERAIAEDGSPEALDGLGRSLWWLKEVAAGMDARSRAYAGFRRAGRLGEAAVVAVWLGREHRRVYGNDAAAEGWLARAESAAARSGDPSAEGWLFVGRAEAAPEAAPGIAFAERAVTIGGEQDDADLEITALSRLGALEIATGKVEAGVGHLDEAMTAASAGEGRDPQSIGEACCALMEASELLGDTERLVKWGKVLEDYARSYEWGPLAGFGSPSTHGTLSAFCGSCCGGIYLVTGRLDDAEKELITAIGDLESTGMQSRCAHPVTQLAELRVVQGRFEEAHALLATYEDLPESVRPLAILDLALGRPEVATARLRGRIGRLGDLDVIALPLWALLVDAELARGDVGAAAQAAEETARISSLTKSGRHAGEAAFAKGKVEAARRAPQAQALLREAATRLSEASLPLLACRARLALARTLAGDERAVAISEARAALAAFERLGATTDADEAAAFLRDLGVKGRTGPKDVGRLSKREVEVLRLVAEGFSNAEIAERLFISVKTAGHHVSNILSKLGLRSRTEAAAFAALHLQKTPR